MTSRERYFRLGSRIHGIHDTNRTRHQLIITVFFSRRLKVQRQMECLCGLQSHQLTQTGQSDAARRDSVSIRDSSVLPSIHIPVMEEQPRYMMVNCSHHLLLSHFKVVFQTLLGSPCAIHFFQSWTSRWSTFRRRTSADSVLSGLHWPFSTNLVHAIT